MTKKCTLAELEPGMILDRTVFTDNGTTLMDAGTVLTEHHIRILESRFRDGFLSFFVHGTAVNDELQAALQGNLKIEPDHGIIDPTYEGLYNEVMEQMRLLFEQGRQTGILDLEIIGTFLADKKLDDLCDGARAVAQIHTMKREGDPILHHCLHVAVLAGLMGRWLRWPRAARERLLLAGLLHDVGKIRVPREILYKKGALNGQEKAEMEKHPKFGYEMLINSGLKNETDILSGVLQHHEFLDGSGYPDKLKSDKIYTYGRILAILDVYDTMATEYGSHQRSPFEIFDVISSELMAGRMDAEYGVLFIKNVCHALVGTWVRLTDGQRAKIVYIDQSRTSALPIVETEHGDFWDIATKKDVKILEILSGDAFA